LGFKKEFQAQLQEQVVDSKGKSKPSFKKEVNKSLQEELVAPVQLGDPSINNNNNFM
jgi:hypothetical protein